MDSIKKYCKANKGFKLHDDKITFNGNTIFSWYNSSGHIHLVSSPPNVMSVGDVYTIDDFQNQVLDYLTNSSGKKYDQDKLRYDLLPTDCIKRLFELDYIMDCSKEDKITHYIYFEESWDWVLYYTTKLLQIELESFNKCIEQLCEIITYGAKKYKPNNWQNVERERYVAAYIRHYVAYLNGEDLDQESGFHHLAHAMCNAMFILWKDTNEQ